MPLFPVSSSAAKGGDIKVSKTEQQIRRIFEEADKDGDGILSKEEVQKAFRQLGARFPAWRALRALRYADSDKDGKISSKNELNNLIKYALDKYGYVFGY